MASEDFDPSLLSEMPLFRGVPARELERLAPLMHERSFPAGTSVITAEQPVEVARDLETFEF